MEGAGNTPRLFVRPYNSSYIVVGMEWDCLVPLFVWSLLRAQMGTDGDYWSFLCFISFACGLAREGFLGWKMDDDGGGKVLW